MGQAIHRRTEKILEKLYPGRFRYSTIGPDFIDTFTGEVIELTTNRDVGPHLTRDHAVNIATYDLPKPRI